MLFAVWKTYLSPKQRGTFLPEVVEAESLEEAAANYAKMRAIGDTYTLLVAPLADVPMVVVRKVRKEYDVDILPSSSVEDDEDGF